MKKPRPRPPSPAQKTAPEAFEKIAEGLREALSVARGQAKPSKLHVPPDLAPAKPPPAPPTPSNLFRVLADPIGRALVDLRGNALVR